MNISAPVRNAIENDFLIDDREVVARSLMVATKLDDYLLDLKALVKSRFIRSDDDNKYQSKLHGLAWIATYVEALKQMSIWAEQLSKRGSFTKTERIILILSFNEYLNQLFGGIMMSQNEIIRPTDLDDEQLTLEKLNCKEVLFFKDEVNVCLLYTSPSPRDATLSRMPSSA